MRRDVTIVRRADGPKPPVPAVSPFFLTEAVSDAAMTYFHDLLFAAEPEISAMFPAPMDTQRRRLYRALHAIAAAETRADAAEAEAAAKGASDGFIPLPPPHLHYFLQAFARWLL